MAILQPLLRKIVPDKTNYRLKLLNLMPSGAVCAEVGVWKGEFSRQILEVTRPSKLHLIDPWSYQPKFPDRIYGGKVAGSQEDMETIFLNVCSQFEQHAEVEINRGYSDDILSQFDDEYFDWLYIDGNHYYEYVLQDLRLGWQKLKPGGLLVGDDYNWGKREGYPVRRAVADFMRQTGIVEKPKMIRSQFIFTKPN